VAIYRAVGEDGDRRWLTRARHAAGDLGHGRFAVGRPERAAGAGRARANVPTACTGADAPFTVDGQPARACFPLATEFEVFGVLELHTRTLRWAPSSCAW
jgi:hypothetical protein